MKICVDPGHSGPFEPGACAGGVREADVNLAISRFLRGELQGRGHQVQATRVGNVGDSLLDWRVKIANEWGADLFICLHCNAHTNIAVEGTETYHFPGSQRGELLASLVQACVTDAVLTENRGVKSASFVVLRDTDCPAILLECAFLTNPTDREMLTHPVEQWRLAAAVAVAVEEYEAKIIAGEAFTRKMPEV